MFASHCVSAWSQRARVVRCGQESDAGYRHAFTAGVLHASKKGGDPFGKEHTRLTPIA